MIGQAIFGAKARARREKMGVTQDEMEKRTGLDQSYLSRVETGTIKRPRWDVAVVIARALGCTVEELVDDDQLRPAA